MKVKFKKNITVNGIQYLQGQEYSITQSVFEFVSYHVEVIEKDNEVTEKEIESKNKIVNKKNVIKK